MSAEDKKKEASNLRLFKAWIQVSVYQELSKNSASHSLSRVYIRHAN